MADSPEPDAKVLFRVPSNDPESDTAEVETLWAARLSSDLYKLDNIPYFAYSVSAEDVVYAPFDDDEGFPTFQSVVEKSGNRTIRVFFETPYENASATFRIVSELKELGAEFEGFNSKIFALNIPPGSDFEVISDYLIENDVQFEFADPTYEELYPDEKD